MKQTRILRSIWTLSPLACRLVVICFLCHVVQTVTARIPVAAGVSFSTALTYCFGLHLPLLGEGFFWQPFTYLFLHSGWWHLAANLAGLYFIGRAVETDAGGDHLLKIFLCGGVFAGLAWCGYTLYAGDPARDLCVGASGGVMALLGAFALLFPRRRVLLLLFWVIPLRIRAGWLLAPILLLPVLEALLLPGRVAFAAHAAGGLFGAVYGWVYRNKGEDDEYDN